MTRKDAILKIRKFLANRRYVFFKKYPDPHKQQLIINAENDLAFIKAGSDSVFMTNAAIFADKYILPLLPSQNSRYRQNFEHLYNQLKKPTI